MSRACSRAATGAGRATKRRPRAELEAEYARLWADIRACAARGDHWEEDRLRNWAMAVLCTLERLWRERGEAYTALNPRLAP